jgi:RNA polymerase sigma-70 factor, ECF subfamily
VNLAHPTTDEELIVRVGKGDRAAMQALYTRHSVRVYRFVLRLVRNQATAEDVTADTFMDVWRQANRFQGRSSVSTWMLSIARFKALSGLRRRSEQELDEERAAELEDDRDDPEVAVEKRDKATILSRCLEALSTEHREVIDLVYYHEKSIEEVAAIVGSPAATVKTRLFYARKRLSDLLKAKGVDRGWP